MSNGNGVKTGIAAVIGAAVLAVTPATSSASSPEDICPAIDTEPVCDLVAQAASNGADSRPATIPLSPRHSTTDVHFDVSCASMPIVRIVACAA
jgi:hypothetical protein